MNNCYTRCCCIPRCCCIVCNCKRPANYYNNQIVPPTPQLDTFAAAGNGTYLHHIITGDRVPFGPALLSIGNAISHQADSDEFIVNTDGIYMIHYQAAMFSGGWAPSMPINGTVEILSDKQGLLHTSHYSVAFKLEMLSFDATLTKGEILKMRYYGDELMSAETQLVDQAISFVRIT